ncbi:helix-turn-helix domain-containing protein [Glutamicibacter sp. MNS18]|uniref:AraC-like ligand-binding domain-containing protein n=1 Tax=Glutamicibacter sp. MNS18 TaxID=2989817 RepID=UPI00223602F6|nr:helix-turn-helix domain-containing protein [Glutamicibacter sp. MNS18]MCW4463910.1 helix-turn-helix domain-containing protein [Glutamicibacter sp. MNS18]
MYHIQHVDSFTAWSKLVSTAFVPLHSEPVRSGHFSASLGINMLGDIGLMKVNAKPHAVVRTDGLAAAGDGRYFKVSLQMHGHGLLVQDGREVVLAPGELAIYDTQRPYTLSFDKDATILVVMIPHDKFRLSHEQVNQITAMRLDSGHPLTGTVTPMLQHLGANLELWDEHGGAALARNATDLLATVLGGALGTATGMNHREGQRERILDYLEAHLADPALNPRSVAQAHFISVRSLHALFADQPESVAAIIRRRRLETAADLLRDPLLAGVPIQLIGTRVGMPDGASFTRAFSGHFGLSPSRYRSVAA